MKVTLDLSKLLEEGKITQAEADKLRALAAREVGSLGINILIGFGVVAVSAGVGALLPTPLTAVMVGAGVFGLGLLLVLARAEQWELLAQICLVIGALTFAAGLVVLDQGSLRAHLAVTAALAGAAILARSSLLMAAAVLALASCIGARAGYWHATYALSITEPAVTIVLFSLVALGAFQISKMLKADYERLALMAARTSVFMINFGFWIGSLWGDRLLLFKSFEDISVIANVGKQPVVIPPLVFTVGWALALAAAGLWAVRANRRWMVNVVAVFAAIHFYTQWFDRLGAKPMSFLVGGLLMLAFALGLWLFNRRLEKTA